MHAEIGLTGPQRLVVRIIGSHPGISAGAVAEILDLHPSTLTEIFCELEKRSVVHRTADPQDRRRAVLRLTPKGRRLDRLHTGTVEEAVRKTLRAVPGRKIAIVQEVLQTLTRHMTPREK
jgi:DNA-binding MarR family transcriptional regulator